MEDDVESLSNVIKSDSGDEISGANAEASQKLDESDAEGVKDAAEAVDQTVSSVNKVIDGEGGKFDNLDDQTTEEALVADVVGSEMIVAESEDSHVETEDKGLGRGGAIEKVEFETVTTTITETIDVKIDQAAEFNSIEKVEEMKDMVDGQESTEMPMGDSDGVEVEGVSEIGGVKEGKTELVDEGREAKGEKVEAQSLQLAVCENPTSVVEGHVDILDKEEIPVVEVRKEVLMTAEQIEDAIVVGRQENISEFNAGVEIVDTDACCKTEEVKEVDDVATLASGGKLPEDTNVGASVLNGPNLENTVDEHVDVSFEHSEHTEAKLVDEKGDVENSNDPKSDELVNEHFHSPHDRDEVVADIVSGMSETKMLNEENMVMEIAKDSKIEDNASPENKDVKDVECLESAMLVDDCASLGAPNNSKLEDAEDKEMDDTNALEHASKKNELMDVESSREPLLGETIEVSESRGSTLITEEHPAGNIRTETDPGDEAELTKKDITDITELRDATLETEGHLAGDIRMDEGAREEEAESTRKDVLEGTSLENNIVFGMATNTVADEPQDEVAGVDSDETRSGDVPGPNLNDSAGAPQDGEDMNMVAEEEDKNTGIHDTEMEAETDVAESGKTPGGKRKRENLSKSPSTKATPRASKKRVGEDVCFICFDGGELVLCDRRGCPKAYHPSCVNRDEAFFKSKGRWNCGWHFCSTCEKNARFMCYTCTFSLCKGCIKDAVFFCVRETKGFCETCMKSVRLIENGDNENKDVTVDFDDKGSWDYLFKDYYVELKEKLSLTSAEISGARNPWRLGDMLPDPSKEPFEARADADDGESGSDNSVENLASNRPKKRKKRKTAKSTLSTGAAPRGKSASSIESSDWASKELLEIVSYMKNGDTSVISQYDVQALLLDYIKRKNLRVPRKKSHIICDARLQNLFGKPRVGHFEMLKLLESHFLLRSEQNDDVQASFADNETQQDVDDNSEPPAKGAKDKKRKPRRKGRGHQSNLEDYAAIDNHNISLIYLRRKLVEDLLNDAENFNNKVVGTFVRIRILGSNQKQDLYRLVQVVGTSKGPDPYKIGKRTTDIMLDILNLNKSETISIDTLSNQDFTEEECKRLRQSIKCGFISRLTVGEILDKAMEIQAARVDDWLESETMRLSHLRDRASDLGRRKELRECVEKLQLLKTPEERQRRMEEIPKINSDPNMDPSHESDDNESEPEDPKRDVFTPSRTSSFNQRARGPMSPISEKDSWSSSSRELSRNMPGNSNLSLSSSQITDIASENLWNPERDRRMRELNVAENIKIKKTEPRYESLSAAASSSTLLPQSPVAKTEPPSVKINESEKMWNYKDPSGKVQGPFSIVQLRKWNSNGYFPADLKIWKANDVQENPILLSDALAGKFPRESPVAIITSPLAATNLRVPQEDRQGSTAAQISGSMSKLPSEKWDRSESTNLPSPTPMQQSPFTIQSPGVNNATVVQSFPSPTPTSPNVALAKSSMMSVSSVVSPTPNSQENFQMGSADLLRSQATITASGPSNGAPMGQNHQIDPQNWSGGPQSTQPHSQGYNWGPPSTQNPGLNFSSSSHQTVGIQPNYYGPIPSNQQATPDATAAATSDGNSNVKWAPQMQQGNNPNVMNWAPQMQPGIGNHQPVHGWANNVAAGNMNPGWAPWAGGGWVAPGGNQGWVGGPQPANHDPTGGSGGRPWNNRQQTYGGGGGSWKRETICPYNANGRCRKGSRCDYRHV